MHHDYTDAQMRTERVQRATKPYGDGSNERNMHREALLALHTGLPDEDVRRAMRRVAENALNPDDGRELLAALGLLEVTQ